NLERYPGVRQFDTDALAARETYRRGCIIDRDTSRHHVHEVGLVARRHDDKAGQAAEIGDVERAGMGLAVLSDKAGPVNREANGQLLDRDVMHDLVVAALQESRVDRGEGLHAFGGEARGKGHRMLLSDPDIEGAL